MDVSKAEDIWRHSYAHPGVWEQAFPPQTMTDLFIASAKAHPAAPLVDFYGRTYS
jgi:long-chain acyl-CoA synthetase